jgi:Fe-S-cluster containining protein
MQDSELVQIVDAALAEAARKSGPWLVCKPGCCECCLGPFAIGQRDAARLRAGLQELSEIDPERAARVRGRARAMAEREMSDDDPCPVLDPDTGTCDLYSARPFTCRVFGPPIQWGSDAVGICELCFDGATDEEIAACTVQLDVADDDAGEETSVAEALA